MKPSTIQLSVRRPRALTSTLVIAALLGATALPTAAWAGPQEATRYYEQAVEAYQAGELRKAADLLERAYAEDPNLVYQYNRILALQGLGELSQAMRLLELYEGPMREDPEKRFEDIEQVKAQIAAEQAQAEAQAEQAQERAQEGEPEPAKTLVEEEPKAGPAEVAQASSEGGSDVLMWSLLGAGAASLTAGGLFGSGVFVSDLDRAEKASAGVGAAMGTGEAREAARPHFPDAEDPLTAYEEVVKQVETHQLLSVIFLGTGAALFLGGALVWLMESGDEVSSGEAMPASAGLDTLRIAPYIGADGYGAGLGFDF